MSKMSNGSTNGMPWDEDKAHENGMLWLPKSRFDARQLKAALTFTYGSSDYKSLKTFHTYTERTHHLGVPRHFLDRDLVRNMGIEIVDLRPASYEEIDIYSKIELDKLRPEVPVQVGAVDAAAKTEDGIISLSCGAGKTLVGLHIWAQRRVPLVIVTDETTVLDQWARMIRLWISPSDLPIGRVFDGHKEWDNPVVLVTVQSLLRMIDKGFPDELRRKFGMMIADETHVLAPPRFSLVAPIFQGYRLGLSATVTRTDRLEPVFQYHLGPVIYQDLSQPLKAKFYFWSPSSTRKLTEDPSFRRRILLYGELNIQKLWTALAEEEKRTVEIAGLIRKLGQNRRTLVISQRKNLLRQLSKLVPNSGVIVSETPRLERQDILAKADVVLGIMRIAQKGLDSPTLSMLVLCEPFKDMNLFQQVVGRILRDRPGKPSPAVIIVKDDVGAGGGPIYGLCRRLQGIISAWPPEKGGPYSHESLNYE